MMCDRRISAGIKGKLYKTGKTSYGLNSVVVRKRQNAELEVAELLESDKVGQN